MIYKLTPVLSIIVNFIIIIIIIIINFITSPHPPGSSKITTPPPLLPRNHFPHTATATAAYRLSPGHTWHPDPWETPTATQRFCIRSRKQCPSQRPLNKKLTRSLVNVSCKIKTIYTCSKKQNGKLKESSNYGVFSGDFAGVPKIFWDDESPVQTFFRKTWPSIFAGIFSAM